MNLDHIRFDFGHVVKKCRIVKETKCIQFYDILRCIFNCFVCLGIDVTFQLVVMGQIKNVKVGYESDWVRLL